MGHGSTKNIMDDFKRVHEELDIVNNLMQLSVDGPNVNGAFLNTLENNLKEEDPDAPSLLSIGGCVDFMYYMVHIKRGHSKKDWDLDKILKAAHGISKDSPARRAVYLADNDIIDQ